MVNIYSKNLQNPHESQVPIDRVPKEIPILEEVDSEGLLDIFPTDSHFNQIQYSQGCTFINPVDVSDFHKHLY